MSSIQLNNSSISISGSYSESLNVSTTEEVISTSSTGKSEKVTAPKVNTQTDITTVNPDKMPKAPGKEETGPKTLLGLSSTGPLQGPNLSGKTGQISLINDLQGIEDDSSNDAQKCQTAVVGFIGQLKNGLDDKDVSQAIGTALSSIDDKISAANAGDYLPAIESAITSCLKELGKEDLNKLVAKLNSQGLYGKIQAGPSDKENIRDLDDVKNYVLIRINDAVIDQVISTIDGSDANSIIAILSPLVNSYMTPCKDEEYIANYILGDIGTRVMDRFGSSLGFRAAMQSNVISDFIDKSRPTGNQSRSWNYDLFRELKHKASHLGQREFTAAMEQFNKTDNLRAVDIDFSVAEKPFFDEVLRFLKNIFVAMFGGEWRTLADDEIVAKAQSWVHGETDGLANGEYLFHLAHEGVSGKNLEKAIAKMMTDQGISEERAGKLSQEVGDILTRAGADWARSGFGQLGESDELILQGLSSSPFSSFLTNYPDLVGQSFEENMFMRHTIFDTLKKEKLHGSALTKRYDKLIQEYVEFNSARRNGEILPDPAQDKNTGLTLKETFTSLVHLLECGNLDKQQSSYEVQLMTLVNRTAQHNEVKMSQLNDYSQQLKVFKQLVDGLSFPQLKILQQAVKSDSFIAACQNNFMLGHNDYVDSLKEVILAREY